MTDFNERFAAAAKELAYIRFISAKINEKTLKVTISGVYNASDAQRFERDRNRIIEELRKLLPPAAKVELVATASSFCGEEIIRIVLDYISTASAFVFSSLKREDISTSTNEKAVTIRVDETVGDYIESGGIATGLRAHLKLRTGTDYAVRIEKREEDPESVMKALESKQYRPRFSYERPGEGRTIDPAGRTPMCGELISEKARYICDCIRPENAVLYGTISDIKESEYTPKKAENGEKRKYATFFLDDTTAKIRCVFFPSAKSESVLKYLVSGAYIIASGSLDYDTRLDDGSLRFTVRRFTGCERTDFTVNKVVRLVDRDYHFVFPEKYVYRTQDAMYCEVKKPLTDEPLVIFDVLTTSRRNFAMGELVGIGAAKIRDGRIIETFGSYINPMGELTDDVRQSLGLTESDIAGKPSFDQVLPDFFKFFDGYALTAFPLDGCVKVLSSYLDKLHIPMPTVVDMTTYADKTVLKREKHKYIGKTVAAALRLAEILTNS